MGMSEPDVRASLGSPDQTQEMNQTGLKMDYWYYNDWQIEFENGYVKSINRY